VIWERLGILPILRAGLGMAEAILKVLPKATVWHLGVYRDHLSHQPIIYYNKLPPQPNIDLGFVVDPMLATGGSAIEAIKILKKWGLSKIKFIGLIAAPEGVSALQAAHPDVAINLGAIDSHLDDNKYIVPGLGDAGDRQFGT
jgi:uracil phosphoribosyltransferase